MAGSDGDILLLAGLEGGGSLSGASGANIKKQLDDIVDALNKSPLKLKVQLDPDSTKDIKKDIDKITKEAKSGSKHLKGILSSSDVGNDGPFGKKAIDSEKAYFENAIRNYQRLSRIESQIDLVNKAKNNWTAAESGNAREYYQNLVQIGEELQAIRNRVNTDGWEVGKLDTGSLEFSLRSIEAIYNTAKERIYALGEATSVENILKEGTTAYKNAIDEIGRLQSKYKNDYIGKWTAANGGASDAAYQGIIAQVEALELLQERVEAGTLSLSQFQKEINNIKTDAKSFVRDIKDAGEAAPADSAEAINNKIRQASEELSRMRGNLNLWTASKDGGTKESYASYEKQSEKLGKYINELKSGGITLAQFNAHFAEIRRNATDAAIAIKEAREAKGIDPKMTSDTKEYADSLEKIQKARFDLNSRLSEWSASGAEGSASFDSFQGLKDVIGLFDELESKIKGQGVSLKEFQFILSNITNTIGEYERAIVDAGENKRVEEKMAAGSKEYIDSLEKLQKARSEVQKDLDSWTAASIQGSNSFDDYNGLKNVLLLFDELEQKIKTDGAGLNEFSNLFAYIVNTANEYRRAIDVGEKHSVDSAEAISNKVRQATTELSRMERNLERWSAAEVGSSSSSYSSYLNSAADLETYIAQLKAGEITLGQFNVLLAKVRENAATAAAEIARMGENTGKIEPIKPGSADQQKILDKLRKSIFNLEGDYNLWEAAGLDGAQSQKAYNGLELVIRALRNLDVELSKSDPTFSLEYAIEQYNKLISKAEEYRRAIKRADEDHSVEKKMTEDSEEYSESLEKVQKKLHELKKNRDKWSASKTGTSASSFGDLESVIGMLEALEENLKNKPLSEFNSELDDLIRKANKASRKIEAAGEDHSVEKKMTSDADDTKDYLASLKKINDEIKSIEANKKKWSAAEDALDTANDYKNMVAQIKDLNDLKTKLEEGKLTLSEFNTEFNKIKLNLSEPTLNILSTQ